MVNFRLYCGGLDKHEVEFTEIDDLKKDELMKKRLFDKDGTLRQLTFRSECTPKYDRSRELFTLTLFDDKGWRDTYLESKNPDEINEAVKKLNVIFFEKKTNG